MLIFTCPEPRGPTELLKNAKNRFQIGFSYFQEGDTNTKNLVCIAKTSCLFETHFMAALDVSVTNLQTDRSWVGLKYYADQNPPAWYWKTMSGSLFPVDHIVVIFRKNRLL